nr:hypothetical protein [Coxiella burnetii]
MSIPSPQVVKIKTKNLKPTILAPSSSPRRRGPSALYALRAKSAPGLPLTRIGVNLRERGKEGVSRS